MSNASLFHFPVQQWRLLAGLMVCICLACLVGLLSRPADSLASLWPANAIMLGVLLRHPPLGRSIWTWVLSWAAYVAMSLIAGSGVWRLSVTFNTAAVVGVFVAWCYLHRQSSAVLHFQRQSSVFVVFLGCLMGSAACAAIGAWGSTGVFHESLVRTYALWLSGDFFGYILFLPVMLAAPRGWFWQWQVAEPRQMPNLWPLVALVVSEGFSLLIGGPGAIGFLMPAMVWSAMVYGLFSLTLLNVIVCLLQSGMLAQGVFHMVSTNVMEAISYRMGLALLSLAPLAVACAYTLRTQLLNKLHHAVDHDYLTGVLARRALMERGQKLLTRMADERLPMAVLMADVDHFKCINDRYGHAQGDIVLQEFAAIARSELRPEDMVGRIGGEEFAIILPRTTQAQALAVAQRLCERVRQHAFPTVTQEAVHVTVSIGLHAVHHPAVSDTLEQLLARADEALYQAKHQGRDQVCHYERPYAPLMA